MKKKQHQMAVSHSPFHYQRLIITFAMVQTLNSEDVLVTSRKLCPLKYGVPENFHTHLMEYRMLMLSSSVHWKFVRKIFKGNMKLNWNL